MRRSSDLVRNRLRQQVGNLDEMTQSLARPVPYRVRLLEFLAKALRYRNSLFGLAVDKVRTSALRCCNLLH